MITMLITIVVTLLVSLIVLIIVFFWKNKQETNKLVFSAKIKYLLWKAFFPTLICTFILFAIHIAYWQGGAPIQKAMEEKYPSYFNSFRVDNEMDNSIPFVIWFSIPYAAAWAYWYIMPAFIYFYCGKKDFYKYVLSIIVMDLLSFMFFIVIPIKNHMQWPDNLNAYPTFIRNLWTFLEKSPGMAYAMCPSGHIYFTLLPFVFVRKNGFKKIATWFSLFAVVLIGASVLLLKIHYIIDIVLAIALVEIVVWFIEKYPYLSEKLNKGMTFINLKLHLETK